jgi:hypothetical protein
MDVKYSLFHPATLVEGKEYILRETRGNGTMVELFPVRFVGFTSSPVYVVVCNGKGQRMRCLRDDLFTNTDSQGKPALLRYLVFGVLKNQRPFDPDYGKQSACTCRLPTFKEKGGNNPAVPNLLVHRQKEPIQRP